MKHLYNVVCLKDTRSYAKVVVKLLSPKGLGRYYHLRKHSWIYQRQRLGRYHHLRKLAKCIQVLTSDRPYEGMNVYEATGLTSSQLETLTGLGAIADCGMYEFKRQLEYKTEKFGSELILVDRFFPSSQICSNCGNHRHKMPLKNRVYICPDCGHTEDRDLNAAKNIDRWFADIFIPVA